MLTNRFKLAFKLICSPCSSNSLTWTFYDLFKSVDKHWNRWQLAYWITFNHVTFIFLDHISVQYFSPWVFFSKSKVYKTPGNPCFKSCNECKNFYELLLWYLLRIAFVVSLALSLFVKDLSNIAINLLNGTVNHTSLLLWLSTSGQ